MKLTTQYLAKQLIIIIALAFLLTETNSKVLKKKTKTKAVVFPISATFWGFSSVKTELEKTTSCPKCFPEIDKKIDYKTKDISTGVESTKELKNTDVASHHLLRHKDIATKVRALMHDVLTRGSSTEKENVLVALTTFLNVDKVNALLGGDKNVKPDAKESKIKSVMELAFKAIEWLPQNLVWGPKPEKRYDDVSDDTIAKSDWNAIPQDTNGNIVRTQVCNAKKALAAAGLAQDLAGQQQLDAATKVVAENATHLIDFFTAWSTLGAADRATVGWAEDTTKTTKTFAAVAVTNDSNPCA